MSDTFELLDVYVVAFLYLRGHKFEMFEKSPGRFGFRFQKTEELLEDLQDFDRGAEVKALDFTNAVKSCRGFIYSEKGKKHQ